MAANNYYGYTPAGTQYSSTGQTTYTAGQTPVSFPVQHVAQTYSAAAYPYTTSQQTIYEKPQTYYPPQVSYTTTETSIFQSPSMYAQPSSITQAASHSAIGQSQIQVIQTTTDSTPKLPSSNWINAYRIGASYQHKPKMIPKTQQFHYCETCKISCAGSQTYKEHLEGQKHKKRESTSKTGTILSRRGQLLRCELCSIICSGFDAYSSHIRGAKHQRVQKLFTKLGKPIPPSEPQPVTSDSSSSKESAEHGITSGMKIESLGANFANSGSTDSRNIKGMAEIVGNKEILPVGQAYLEEVKNEVGKTLSYQCKLCDCSFNDPNAKDMHMKGRKHRLQYKKKVDPEFVVDVKPSIREKKLHEGRHWRHPVPPWPRHENEMCMFENRQFLYWEQRRHERSMPFDDWHHRYSHDVRMNAPPLRGRSWGNYSMSGGGYFRKVETIDDRHVSLKHKEICPKEREITVRRNIVTNCEKALKLVSDTLIKKNISDTLNVKKEISDDSDENLAGSNTQQSRLLIGVMRVGILGKDLVLTGERNMDLVLVCSEKPTCTLLEQVLDNFKKQLEIIVPNEKYEIKSYVNDACIIVTTTDELKFSVIITLTSRLMRELNDIHDPPDILNKEKCLEALAYLRRTKWFKAKAVPLQSCLIVIRVLRDLCQRNPTWSRFKSWALELLVENVLRSVGQPTGPGNALKCVFEAISCGVLLPGSSEIFDPCENESVDALNLSRQEREDITASAQQALRLIAFRQIHKVLDIEPLVPSKFPIGSRKRHYDNIGEEESQNKKKGKLGGDDQSETDKNKN